MAENIFDRIVIERVDLDITIGPKTFNLSGNIEFHNYPLKLEIHEQNLC